MLKEIGFRVQKIPLATLLFALSVFAWLSTLVAVYEQLPYGAVWNYIHYAVAYYLLEAAALVFILKRLGINSWMVALLLVSTLPQVHLLFKTPPFHASPDVGGHMDYIKALIANNYIPPTPWGWQHQQPFLYYLWCALAHSIGLWLNNPQTWQYIWVPDRIASRILYLGYVIFSVLLINKLRIRFLLKIAVVSVIAFWPSAYMVSIRINSDIGFYFFFMAALYFLHDWYGKLSTKSLAFAISAAALSLLCKGTGVISLVMVACVALYVLVRRRVSLRYFFNKAVLLSVVVLALCFAGYFGRIAYYIWFHNADLKWFANVTMEEVIVMYPLQLKDIFNFNVLDFITVPGFEWSKYDGRQYSLWGALWRTLIYDDFNTTGPKTLLMIIQALWLGIVCMLVVQLVCYMRIMSPHGYAVFFCAFLTIILIAIAQRAQIPDSRLLLGRRIYPIIPIIMIMAAGCMQVQYDKGRKYIYLVCVLICIFFSMASYALVLHRAQDTTYHL
jgi:hypothetical protein